ncbi:MAG: T9SS type A sorting domain-containing protein [Ignavibacteriae bacterium]|nr:T9SS type A sorting domain-containing protein [Ignavibacteriota bacterium]
MKYVLLLLCYVIYLPDTASAIEQHSVKQSQTVFIQNKGQWSADVLYLARLKGTDAWITKQGIRYDFHTIEPAKKIKTSAHLTDKNTLSKRVIHGNVVDVGCTGGKTFANTPLGKQKSYYNYFIGNDKSKWASFVPAYNEVILKEIYKGIDERLYFENGYMRYDFMIAPHGNTKDIAMSFKGAKGVNVNPNGELVIHTSIGDILQQKLYAYQMNGNDRKKVECSFVVKSNNKIGFSVGNYDYSKPLVIDPLLYSTFLGGAGDEEGGKIVLDLSNNVIVTGSTYSSNFPTQLGSYDRTIDGGSDAYVAKFTSDLSDLMFCTYYGGTLDDIAKSCAVDAAGYIVFCGNTFSNNLPNKNVEFDMSYNSSNKSDGFVAKLSYTGADLIYGSYLGGSDVDVVSDVVLVPFSNAAIVVGTTYSTDFQTTVGALKTTNKYRSDGFVTKVNESGSGLVFSTYLGLDSTHDECYGVALDRDDHPIVVGSTQNTTFPTEFSTDPHNKISFKTTASAIRPTNTNLFYTDGFLVKLGVNGESLDYSTLIGGSSGDECLSVDVDKQGIAVVCGYTESDVNFNPTVFDKTFDGAREGFVMRLGTTGGFYYSSYLGGSSEDRAFGVKYYDNTGSVVVAGYTTSPDFPTGKINDYTYHSGTEGFVIQFSGNGSVCQYSSFVGGSTVDQINSIAVSNVGYVYVTGATQSADLQTTPKSKFPQFNGNIDGFICVLNTCSITVDPPKDTIVCPGKPLTLINKATGSGSLTFNWVDLAKGVSIGTADSVIVTPNEQSIYSFTATDDICSKTVTYVVKTKPLPTVSTSAERKACVGTSLKLSASSNPGTIIQWYDAIDATAPIGTGNLFTTVPLKNSIVLYAESQDTSTKCTSERKEIRVNVVPPPATPTADNASICANNSVQLSAIFPSDVNFQWYDSLTGGRLLQVGQKFITPKLLATTVYYLESLDTSTNCTSTKRTPVKVTILPSPNPIIQGQNAACVNSTGLEYSVLPNPNREYTWNTSLNGIITAGDGTSKITVSWTGLGPGLISLSEKDLISKCTKDTSFAVNVSQQLTTKLDVIGSLNLCTGDSVVLDAGQGYSSYKWSNGEISQRITVKTAGDYSVLVQDAGGCKGGSNVVNVTVGTPPNAVLTGQITACLNTQLEYSVPYDKDNIYNWVISSEGVIISGQGTSSITVNWITSGIGSVTVHVSSLSCTKENTMKVAVSSSLSFEIKPNGKTSLCDGESVVLDAGEFSSYTWSTGETSRTITVQTPGTYTVHVIDINGCSGMSRQMVITKSNAPLPVITAIGKTELCEGDSVILDAGVFNEYLWANGATSQMIAVKTTGKYSVTVTNSSGCKGTSPEQIITVSPLPVAPIITQKGDDSLVVSPYDVVNAYSWRLNGAAIGNTSETVSVSSEGNYTVEVTSSNGCKNVSVPFSYLKPNSSSLTVSVSPLVIEALAGESVRVPLVITSSKNLTQATASNFTAEISVEPSILTLANGTSTIDNGNRRIITVNGIRKDENDTLAVIEMKAGLGDVETSSILLKSFVFQSGKVQVTTRDGEFHLKGICRDSGVRLYNSGSILSLSVQPNPASDVLNMMITPAEEGLHRIALTNTLGEEISILYNDKITAVKEISSSLVDVPAGVYFVVLQSPSEIIVKRVLIAK